jgi:hypothetical protein
MQQQLQASFSWISNSLIYFQAVSQAVQAQAIQQQPHTAQATALHLQQQQAAAANSAGGYLNYATLHVSFWGNHFLSKNCFSGNGRTIGMFSNFRTL